MLDAFVIYERSGSPPFRRRGYYQGGRATERELGGVSGGIGGGE